MSIAQQALRLLVLMLGLVLSGAIHVSADQAQYIYDDLGRLVQVIDGQGNDATYAYDAVGNLLSITRYTGRSSARRSRPRRLRLYRASRRSPKHSPLNPNTSISVAFNESVNPLTVNSSTFIVSAGGPLLAGQPVFSTFNHSAGAK